MARRQACEQSGLGFGCSRCRWSLTGCLACNPMKKESHASKEVKRKAQYSLLKAMENGWAHTMKRRARTKNKNPSLPISLTPDPKQREAGSDIGTIIARDVIAKALSSLPSTSSAPGSGGEEPGASRAGVDPDP